MKMVKNMKAIFRIIYIMEKVVWLYKMAKYLNVNFKMELNKEKAYYNFQMVICFMEIFKMIKETE